MNIKKGDTVYMKSQFGWGTVLFETGTECEVMSGVEDNQRLLKRKEDDVTLWVPADSFLKWEPLFKKRT